MIHKVRAFARERKQVAEGGDGHHGQAVLLRDGLRRRLRMRLAGTLLAVQRDDDAGGNAADVPDHAERFADGGAGGDHIVDDQHALAHQRRADQQAAFAMRLGFLPVEGEGNVAAAPGEFARHRRRQRDALVGRPEQHVERHARLAQRVGVARGQLGQCRAAVEATGVEEVRALAPRLQRERAEAQGLRTQREGEEAGAVVGHGGHFKAAGAGESATLGPAFQNGPRFAHRQLQRQWRPLRRRQGVLRLVPRAGRRCALPAGNQGAGTPGLRPRLHFGGVSRVLPRRHDEEGLQRRGPLCPARARRGAHLPGLGTVRRRGALHRGAFRQPQRRVLLHPVRFVGRAAPGLQVRSDGVARADPPPLAAQRPRLRALRRLEHRAQRAGHQELEVEPEELRLPAARARLVEWPVRREERLGRRVSRAARRRPGLHLVEQSRRGPCEGRGLAHRLPVLHAVVARQAEGLFDPSRAPVLRSRALRRGLRPLSTTTRDTATAAKPKKPSVWKAFTQPAAWTMFFLGFASGLQFLLVAGTLAYWLKQNGIVLKEITIIASAGMTYALKFLWAPLLDHTRLPLFSRLGQRRGWLLFAQIGVVVGLVGMAMVTPSQLGTFVGFTLLVAFAGATQDIAVDAYRIEIGAPSDQGALVATYSLGYRIALIVTGAFALFMADHMP